jgi:putative membrane protein
MEKVGSLNRSMNNALKHYSSMFFLPSHKKALTANAIICIIALGLSTFALFPTLQGLAGGLALGLSLFAVTLLADILTSKVFLAKDPIFILRRTVAISYFCWLLWLLFIALGVVLGGVLSLPVLWAKFCLGGYAAVVSLRVIVLYATSGSSMWRRIMAALFEPFLNAIMFLGFWIVFNVDGLLHVLPFIILSPIIAFLASYLLLSSIDRLGKKGYGLPTLLLFRAFLLNWVTGLNEPLEKQLEEMGEDADIEVNLLKFDSSKPKAAVIVPIVHPGPFKNIGSSLLPSLLKLGFEKEFGCSTAIPLGLLGHELDLASQAQNQKILSALIASAKFKASTALASPRVKVTEGTATASCQIFGDTALLSFSLAPETTEDLPQELGRLVEEEAAKYGLKYAMVVNAHNSLTEVIDTEEHLGALQIAASKCLQKAVAQPTKAFMVGAASVFPKEFTLKEGMGTGGITAIVVQVETQKTAYVIIDGNNMISGFREKILAALSSLGFDESEVFTTDTHAVSALVTGRRGYHPVGEAMDQELVLRYISEAARKAESNLEVSKAGYLHLVVPKVRVIGEERLHSMTTLVDEAIKKAKKIVIPIFGLEALLLLLLLLLL